MLSTKVSNINAESVWKKLNGLICIYKSSGESCFHVKHSISSNLCKELNSLETRPPRNYIEVNNINSEISLKIRPSFADNVLCVGPRYQPVDIDMYFPSFLSKFSSGVLVAGINNGQLTAKAIESCGFTKCFHVSGVLGQASSDFLSDSRIIARAKYEHITQNLLDKILTSYQGVNQRKMFLEYGLDLRSQMAYDFAVSGLYRPDKTGATIVYSMKTVEFKPPDFIIEIQCINETDDYIKNTIHNLGVSLKCFATCSAIRCLRYGCFTVDHALCYKQFNLQNVMTNMENNQKILKERYPEYLEYIPDVTSAKKRTKK